MSTALQPQDIAPLPVPSTRRPVPLARYAEFLPDAEALSERRHSPAVRWLVFLLSAMVLSALVWSALARVDQVVTAAGAVRPSDKVKVVNHPAGGRVTALHVHEGDHVLAGQPLLEIDGETLGEEALKRRNDWQALAVAVARLEAESSGEPLGFPGDLAALRPDLIAQQTTLYEARRTAFAAQWRSLDEAVRQHQHEAQSAAAKERQAAATWRS